MLISIPDEFLEQLSKVRMFVGNLGYLFVVPSVVGYELCIDQT